MSAQRERRGPAVRAGRRAWAWRSAATGTHPWANYLDQRIIDTPHYNRLRHELGWVAQRNNTWSLHVHMGMRGADRAIAVCDWLRELLPLLLARLGQLALPRPPRHRPAHGPHRDLHPHLPALRHSRAVRRLGRATRDFVGSWSGPSSIVESTQLWWSVRPHHRFGTVEVRICDAQTRGDESFALAGLIAACIAQTALDYDEHGYDGAGSPLADREIEENLWRAIRYGMDGELIDFRRGREVEAGAGASSELLEWTEPARDRARHRGRAARGATAPSGRGEALADGSLDRGHLPRRRGGDEAHLRPRGGGRRG